MYKRFFAILAAVITALFLFGSPATAASGNPHFIKNATSATLSGPNLKVSFKEVGLPSGSTETVTITATATTTYECVNNGGKNPSASNKTTTQTDVSTSGTFTADRSGNITGTLTLTPPTASELGFTCPPGQTVTFVSVVYSNVVITDTTSGASTSFPGTFTYTDPTAP
ncbi:hypothetical protein [Arthrobacter sp. UYCo732]|uniref:hypothetical protein n=1 Tax=Arthrobacter sp. UYCo732 TaxID=3156336 RepID=UPI003391B1F4